MTNLNPTIIPNTGASVNVERFMPIYEWLRRGGENLKTDNSAYDFLYREWSCARVEDYKLHRAPGHCGRLCCIGGAAEALYATELLSIYGEDLWRNDSKIAEFMGLSIPVMRSLFYPGNAVIASGGNPYELSAQEVAKVLKRLMDTNVLDWSIV